MRLTVEDVERLEFADDILTLLTNPKCDLTVTSTMDLLIEAKSKIDQTITALTPMSNGGGDDIPF